MDKEREIVFEHRLQLKRIIIDKVLLGLVLASFALLSDFLIEGYKSNEARNRFILEQRVASLKAIRQNFSEAAHDVSSLSGLACQKKEISNSDVDAAAEKARMFLVSISDNNMLLSGGFSEVGVSMANIQLGILGNLSSKECLYRNFVSDVNVHFSRALRDELGLDKSDEKGGFHIDPLSSAGEINGTVSEYFNIVYENWLLWRKGISAQ